MAYKYYTLHRSSAEYDKYLDRMSKDGMKKSNIIGLSGNTNYPGGWEVRNLGNYSGCVEIYMNRESPYGWTPRKRTKDSPRLSYGPKMDNYFD